MSLVEGGTTFEAYVLRVTRAAARKEVAQGAGDDGIDDGCVDVSVVHYPLRSACCQYSARDAIYLTTHDPCAVVEIDDKILAGPIRFVS